MTRNPEPISLVFIAVFLVLLAGLPLPGRSQPAATITQHRINELAAALERGRYALVEDVGLRGPNETLDAYLTRLIAPLPGEKPNRWKTRLESYVAALTRATEETATGRHIPALRDTGADNRRLWQRASQDLSHLPDRLTRLQAAWKDAQKTANDGGKSPAPGRPQPLEAQFAQMLRFLNDALEALRNARP